MPRYMIQAAYTAEAAAAFVSNPQDRAPGIRTLAQQLGGTMHSIDFCLGDDDVIAIFSAPDDTAAAAVALAASAPGHLKRFKTTKLLTPEEFLAAQQQAHGVSYLAPTRA